MFETEIERLKRCPRRKFLNWEKEKRLLPKKAGVYIIWRDDRLLYAGMAEDNDEGLSRRLNKHALGQRGGDQFCSRVCDAFIVPFLSQDQFERLKKGVNIFDGKRGLIRKFVRGNLEYQYLETENTEIARQLEEVLRTGNSPYGQPFLNAKNSR